MKSRYVVNVEEILGMSVSDRIVQWIFAEKEEE